MGPKGPFGLSDSPVPVANLVVVEPIQGLRTVRLSPLDQPERSLAEDWRARALCAHSDPELWFSVGALEHRLAKKTCRACPVRRECLAYAMDSCVDDGICGGLTERERRWLRQRAGSGDWRALVPESAASS